MKPVSIASERLSLSTVHVMVGIAVLVWGSASANEQQRSDFFESRVRPILVDHCGECHGEGKTESGLGMDSRAALLNGGDRGAAVVPGDAANSLLMEALSYRVEDLAMPPDGRLDDDQIGAIRKWIDDGAVWPADETKRSAASESVSGAAEHWAFQPVRPLADHRIPKVQDEAWPRNAIDHFILSELESKGLSPSPDTDRLTFLRRIYLDLIGLPPTVDDQSNTLWDEVNKSTGTVLTDEFVAERVEPLLARREYGERWGRHWLDVARYADTKGYVDGGQARYAFAYTYRDYVIRALNEDKPYDEFLREQLAADRLYGNGVSGRTLSVADWKLSATGFLLVGRRFNHNFHDTLDDQIDVVCRGLLGLTVTCARCHDHKYDPIPTADYYSLYGILANSEERSHALTPPFKAARSDEEFDEYAADLHRAHAEFQEQYTALRDTIQHELRAYCGDYLVYIVQESDRHRESPQNPLKTERTMLRGPSAYGFGAFPRWRRFLANQSESDSVFGVWCQMDKVDRSEFTDRLAAVLSDGSAINPLLLERLQQDSPTSMVSLARCYGELLETIYAEWQALRKERPAAASFEDPNREQLRQVLYGDRSPATMTRFESIDLYHLDEHTKMRNVQGAIEAVSLEFENPPPRPMTFTPREDLISATVFLRGRPDRPGSAVPQRVPSVLRSGVTVPAAADHRPEVRDHANEWRDGRLELADAIADRQNPLTARVIVNRVWDWHFGQPLVTTPSDFGLRSAPPTHPALLDYLAAWFMENGWSLKDLHRLIMTSRTYRQQSVFRSEWAAVDPVNRYLWRYRPRRAEWEVIRDSLLAVSGQLECRAGGPPVEKDPADPDARCRTIYLHIDRQHLSDFARNFDFPAPDFTAPRRASTTVPQQQLFFLNSPFVWSQAKALGAWVAGLKDLSDADRFRRLYVRILSRRPPEPDESQRLIDTFVNAASNDEGIPVQRQGMSAESWVNIAHGLLQSNEFVFIE